MTRRDRNFAVAPSVEQLAEMIAPLYRVVWKSKLTGLTGCGEPVSQGTAQALADRGNEQLPDIQHWIEEAL